MSMRRHVVRLRLASWFFVPHMITGLVTRLAKLVMVNTFRFPYIVQLSPSSVEVTSP